MSGRARRLRGMRRLSHCAVASILLGGPAGCAGIASVAGVSAAVAAEGPIDRSCEPSAMRIVIDVGHTPEAGGALSARGVREYEFNLRLATEISKALLAAGFRSSQLMTTRGTRRTLEQRADRANRMQADLFVSVHHDSVQDFYLRRWIYRGRPHLYSDRFNGYSLFVSNDNSHPDASRRFAMDLAQELKARGLAFTTHHAEKIKGENRELIDCARSRRVPLRRACRAQAHECSGGAAGSGRHRQPGGRARCRERRFSRPRGCSGGGGGPPLLRRGRLRQDGMSARRSKAADAAMVARAAAGYDRAAF
jgi:N-acetylmuramoyl-L-alanine amidase